MARMQQTGTYAGKGQKRTQQRIESLERNYGVLFDGADSFDSRPVATLADGQQINADRKIGRRKVVAAVERALGLVWYSDMGTMHGHYQVGTPRE